MIKRHKYILLLLFITIVAAVFRLVALGDVPVGFHRDEAFFGYNAYSLLKTGKDMTGDFLPLHLRSFLNSPAIYSYAAFPFVALFDLTPFAVRFPSALFGIASVPLLFVAVRLLFREHQHKNIIAIVSGMFLAISPWHINLSRVATENVLVVFFLLLGLICYLESIYRKNAVLLLGSMMMFFCTLFIYQAPRAFVPLLLPLLFGIYLKEMTMRMKVVFWVSYCLLIVIPLAVIMSSPLLSERIQMLSIFNHPQSQLILEEQLREDGVAGVSPLIARVFHNKIVTYAATFFSNYAAYFSLDFYLTDKILPIRYKIPMSGLMSFTEIIAIFIGAVVVMKKNRREMLVLFGWVVLAPIGSALTFDDIPNMQRTLLMIPAFAILAGYGFSHLMVMIKRWRYSGVVLTLVVGFMLYQLSYFVHQYFVAGVYHQPWYRNEGYKELVNATRAITNPVIVTTGESDPYIFYLFYEKYNPSLIQKLYSEKGDIYKTTLNNISFKQVDCPLKESTEMDPVTRRPYTKIDGVKGSVYVNLGQCPIPKHGVKELKVITRKDNSAIFRIVQLAGNEK